MSLEGGIMVLLTHQWIIVGYKWTTDKYMYNVEAKKKVLWDNAETFYFQV